MNPKKLALEALRCPVRQAVIQAWEKSRTHAWRLNENLAAFIPDEAVDAMKVNMGQLARLGIVTWWKLEIFEGWLRTEWQLEVTYTFRAEGGARQTGSERFRVW